ncbi:serine hydrolase domain-containing protein [Candidiatus Paracoxiella cheracis]|uniref:serine hydrolase domain-containing protein n=1 Tax=Candidiatus Paracoxiella cheracis TaxID=3405120 RepID=UPI003BF579C4
MIRELFICSCLMLCSASVAHADISNMQQNIQQQINNDRDVYKIGAIAVSYELADSNDVYSNYSGATKLDGEKPVGPDNLFQVGSITKSFIAATILQLEQEGKLKITDPIGKYLPNYVKWRSITIRQLLNHTSGIYDYTILPQFDHVSTPDNDHKQWTPQEIVASVYDHKPYFQPGEGFHYSNTNYILLGMLIHKITHQTVQYELDHRFLREDQLDLTNSYYLPGKYPHSILAWLVDGYFLNKNETHINMSWAGSAGALVSNSIDLVRWVKQLMTGKVLQTQQLRELKTLVSIPAGKPLPKNSRDFAYGLGIKRVYQPNIGLIWFHPGATTGYTAIMVWLPKKHIALAVTTNAGNLGREKIKQIAFGLLELLISR